MFNKNIVSLQEKFCTKTAQLFTNLVLNIISYQMISFNFHKNFDYDKQNHESPVIKNMFARKLISAIMWSNSVLAVSANIMLTIVNYIHEINN